MYDIERYITLLLLYYTTIKTQESIRFSHNNQFKPNLFSIMFLFFFVFLQYEELADKDDLMGVEDTAKKDIFCFIEYWLFIKSAFHLSGIGCTYLPTPLHEQDARQG